MLCLAEAYSVLTHEEVIDLAWEDQIHPMLVQRFPHATSDELKQAYAYAYRGSLIQGMGYYPLGFNISGPRLCRADKRFRC